jgi:2-amino-4-hydroxy-6-hydroxymethyldihydropteridine diphosphokinase
VQRWAPRRLDLDLLLFDDMVCDEPALRLPHPEMGRRAFVLAPLAELDPTCVIPGQGPVAALLARLNEAERGILGVQRGWWLGG